MAEQVQRKTQNEKKLQRELAKAQKQLARLKHKDLLKKGEREQRKLASSFERFVLKSVYSVIGKPEED